MNSINDQLSLLGDVVDLTWQSDLLRECRELNRPLSEILSSKGLSYEDLRYEFDARPVFQNSKLKSIDDYRISAPSIPMVSFFAGAGGLDLGFEAQGFEHQALIEKTSLFCETLKLNRPQWHVHCGDVSKTDEIVGGLDKVIGRERVFDGVFVGGPPCQPFSIAANQRFSKSGDKFKRIGFSHATNGNLLFDYISIIGIYKPRVFLIENVPGLQEVDGGQQLARAMEQLSRCGYSVCRPLLLRAEFYGVPQQRRRLFIVGHRTEGIFTPPQPEATAAVCGPLFEMPLDGCINHVTRSHSVDSIERYVRLGYGCRDKLGRVDRLDPLKPSKTIIAGGSSGGGRSHLHPYIPRTLSVRECARLQTFPDNYEFTGPVARQFTQVGNAVPPLLGAQLAEALRHSFFG